jgi:hypothetical protein
MVPDRSDGSRARTETDERAAGDPTSPAGENSTELSTGTIDDDTYDLVYRAAREAIWDVLGTATLILFYLALAAIGLSIAVGGIGPFLRGSASYTALAVGVLALVVGAFAVVRVYRLVTE